MVTNKFLCINFKQFSACMHTLTTIQPRRNFLDVPKSSRAFDWCANFVWGVFGVFEDNVIICLHLLLLSLIYQSASIYPFALSFIRRHRLFFSLLFIPFLKFFFIHWSIDHVLHTRTHAHITYLYTQTHMHVNINICFCYYLL